MTFTVNIHRLSVTLAYIIASVNERIKLINHTLETTIMTAVQVVLLLLLSRTCPIGVHRL